MYIIKGETLFSFKCSFPFVGSLRVLLSHHWVFIPFQRSSPGMFVFYSFWLGLTCGFMKTVTKTSAQFGKEAWMEVVSKIMSRSHSD